MNWVAKIEMEHQLKEENFQWVQIKNKSAYIKDPFFKRKDDKSENIDQEISILNSQPANPFHNRSVQNDMRKSAALKERGYRPNDKRTHNVYSSMFSNASGIQSQMNSIMLPKRPGSNASVVNSEYNVTSSVETSQNSLRQAIMSTIKRKTSKNDERIQYPISDQITQLDSKFTKSLQINSPDSKFSHRENKIVVKSPQRKFTVKYKTTLIGHQNTITWLAFNTKFYTSLYSGSKDYTIKAWHWTSFSPRTIITDDSTLQKAESSYKTINTHTKYINSLWFLPNSGLLVSSGADQRLAVTNVFNSEEFETVRSFRKTFGTINHIISMNTNGFEIDECKIIIGSNDKTIRLIDLNSPDKVVTKMINNDSSIRYLKLHSSNNYLMTADSTNSIKLWDIRTSSQVSSFKDKGGKYKFVIK